MGEALKLSDRSTSDWRVAEISSLWLKDRAYLLRVSLCLTHGNLEDSEDLLSQALLKILSNINYSAGNIINPRALFIDVVRKEFFSGYRKRKRHIQMQPYFPAKECSVPPDIVDEAPTQFDSCAGKEEMNLVMKGVRALPISQREALSLRIFGGFSYQEISQRLHVTPALARKRVQLARQNLRAFVISQNNSYG